MGLRMKTLEDVLGILTRDWMDEAACGYADVDPDWFHPETTSSGRVEGWTLTERRAKAVCATCPVRSQCLTFMYETGETPSIWGGTTARERRAVAHRDDCKAVCGVGGGCNPISERVFVLVANMAEQAERTGLVREDTWRGIA